MGTLSKKMLQQAIRNAWESVGKEHTKSVYSRKGNKFDMKYKVIGIIAAGTFGVVMKIESGARIYALKVVYEDLRYINRELELLLKLDHLHVIGLVAHCTEQETPHGHYRCLFLEYLPIILETILNTKPDLDKLQKLYRQALTGLDYLHKKGITHRDIKPCNILIDDEWNLKICDMGTAKLIEEGCKNIAYICSRYYRAPENLLGYEYYNTKIDIWAIALVFVEFRTDEPLFKEEDSEGMLSKIVDLLVVSKSVLELYKCSQIKAKTTTKLRRVLNKYFADEDLLDVFERSLKFDYRERPTAEELLKMPFFTRE